MRKLGWLFVVIFMFALSANGNEAPRLTDNVRDLAKHGKKVTTEHMLKSLSQSELNATATGNATKSALIKRSDWQEITWVGQAEVGAIVTYRYCFEQEYCTPATSFEVPESGNWAWTVWSGSANTLTTTTRMTVEVAMFDRSNLDFELLSAYTYFGEVPSEFDTGISDVYSYGNQLVILGQFNRDTTVWIDGVKVPSDQFWWDGVLHVMNVQSTSLAFWRGPHSVTTVTDNKSDTYVYRYAPRYAGKGALPMPQK